jgi:mRNA-degrading endonuclease RelE of RelBE toxin-antitoxin system
MTGARWGTGYRVRYLDGSSHTVIVVDISHRRDAYQ